MPLYRNDAFDYCRWVTRWSHSHFWLGIQMLPIQRRKGMEAVYAFCRAIDDVVDSGSGTQEALNRWRRELELCYQGVPTHPIAVALQEVIQRYRISPVHFEELVLGVEMDLIPRRFGTFSELQRYCERVASAVGLISIRVFGCQHPAAERYAHDLGVALQLVNILRDLKTDGQQGRVYLPQEELKRFDYSESDLLEGRTNDRFKTLMVFQRDRAEQFFQSAQAALLESREAGLLRPARIMGGVYRELLAQMEQSRYDVFSRRISVPWNRQLWIAAKTFIGSS